MSLSNNAKIALDPFDDTHLRKPPFGLVRGFWRNLEFLDKRVCKKHVVPLSNG